MRETSELANRDAATRAAPLVPHPRPSVHSAPVAVATLPPPASFASRRADLVRLDRDVRSAGESFGWDGACDPVVAGNTAVFGSLLWWIAGLAAFLGLAILGLG